MATDKPGGADNHDQAGPGPGTPRPPEPSWTTPPPASPPPGSWGPPPRQPAPPPGQWGDAGGGGYSPLPPPGQPPQQGWGAPGQLQPDWGGAPPPVQSSGGGCLKACLIVTVILVALAVLAFIALFAVGSSVVSGLGIQSNGSIKACSIVSTAQVQSVLGPDAQAGPLAGLANTIGGVALDKRVLPDAENCWIGSESSAGSGQATGEIGRVAKYSGSDAPSVFSQARSDAQSGQYLAKDVPGAGDEAFCTGRSSRYPGTGALVLKGGYLVYVSFLVGPNTHFDSASGESGQPYSPQACGDAVAIALLALHWSACGLAASDLAASAAPGARRACGVAARAEQQPDPLLERARLHGDGPKADARRARGV